MKYQVLLKDPPRSTVYFVDIILKIGPTTRLWVKYLLSDPPLSVSVFDKNLNFLKRIPLNSPHFKSNTSTFSIRLHENNMYVMFGRSDYCLQVFSQDGQLIRCVVPRSYIKLSFYFSLDRIGNIIVADWLGHKIEIFSNSGLLIHTISNHMLTEDQKLLYPMGISVDKQNNIVVAHNNQKCSLISF